MDLWETNKVKQREREINLTKIYGDEIAEYGWF